MITSLRLHTRSYLGNALEMLARLANLLGFGSLLIKWCWAILYVLLMTFISCKPLLQVS